MDAMSTASNASMKISLSMVPFKSVQTRGTNKNSRWRSKILVATITILMKV